MEYSYEALKQLAKERGQKVTDFVALAPQNDPFYTGSPTEKLLAEWFADLWYRFRYTDNVHIRRVHYQIVSQSPTVMLPNGTPYENTIECWDTLMMAAKHARYLRLVDPGAFRDRKNPEAIQHAQDYTLVPELNVNAYGVEAELPDFPSGPTFDLYGYEGSQRYHIELCCEKTTMNDILEPLCRQYGMNLQTGAGELSITAALNLVRRIERIGKPTRIFYISDFDPAGQSMPLAIGRKLEYFIRTLGLQVDVRLFSLVLTPRQVATYSLPRTPIKESERRRAGFEERHGGGATELDALEALRPGELERILVRAIRQYYDTSLNNRVYDARRELERTLIDLRQEVLEEHNSEIEALRNRYEAIRAEFAQRVQDYNEDLSSLWATITEDMQGRTPDLDEYPIPDGTEADELGDGLYNSDRSYLEQIEAYKAFQGK
jgi:hypothetical protein